MRQFNIFNQVDEVEFIDGDYKVKHNNKKTQEQMKTFTQYDKENPHIWLEFIKQTRRAKIKGFKNYGANMIIQQIRWETKTAATEGYKINNNYAPDYARKMMRLFPDEFKGFFRTKALKKVRTNSEK